MSGRLINLTFHGIGPSARPLEPRELEGWLERDRFVAILDAVAGRDDVRITFDDGNASDVVHALPALRDRGLRAVFFVVAGQVGTPGFLGEQDLRELAGAGMAIGTHGMRHRPWRRLDRRALREELVEARARLEDIVGRPVTEAACPFGSYDRRVLRRLRRCGYRQVFTSDRGTSGPDAWMQARNTVHHDDGADVVERVLASEPSSYHALRRRAELVAKRWR